VPAPFVCLRLSSFPGHLARDAGERVTIGPVRIRSITIMHTEVIIDRIPIIIDIARASMPPLTLVQNREAVSII
jgi:hypothetical protein